MASEMTGILNSTIIYQNEQKKELLLYAVPDSLSPTASCQ